MLAVHGDQIFLDGFVYLLRALDRSYDCRTTVSPSQALEILRGGRRFELIFVDLALPQMDGVTFLRALKSRHDRTPVVILAAADRVAQVAAAVRAGARGFVPKTADKLQLHAAIRCVLGGEVYLPGTFWDDVNARPALPASVPAAPGAVDPPKALGERQMDVLGLLAAGHSNKQIGLVLNITENTVKSHLKLLFRQLGVARRTACVRRARELDLL